MINGRIVLAFMAIATGVFVAFRGLRTEGEQMNRANIVPQPMVGGHSGSTTNREGPWPACLGMTGSACASMIQSMATDLDPSNIIVMNFDSIMTMDYRTDRVRIMVNDEGTVVQTPGRG